MFDELSNKPVHHPAGLAVSPPGRSGLADQVRTLRRWVRPGKIGLFLLSIFLFILAVTLMKEGAYGLTPLVRDSFEINNVANSLGFGWLFAYLIMSGSPVAAAALTFLDAGAIDRLSTFAMISGSRLGASFIVLFIGFMYVLRGRDRATGLDMGLLSLTVTGTTYLAAFVIGLGLLQSNIVEQIPSGSSQTLNSIVDLIFDPIIRLLLGMVPRWALFLVGLGLIMLSFHLFDRCLPQMALKESQIGQMSRLVYRPWVMFVLGAVLTLISMSVSISLGLLVPLSNRGFIRRENVIPYIMGANITTFIDTMLAAMLIGNPAARVVVFVEMLSITIVSIIILSLFFRWYERAMLACVNWITAERFHIILFMVIISAVPVILLLV